MSKRNKSLTVGLVSALFIYCLLGFLLLPGIALDLINKELDQRVNVPARLDSLQFNPFSLELTLGNLEIGEAEDPLLGFQRLHANLQVSSLWRGALQLDSLVIERAQVAAVLRESGTLNLTQLMNAPHSEPKDSGEALFPVRIERLELVNSQLDFQDRQPSTPVQTSFDKINLEVQQFSTVDAERAEMSLQASGPSGSQLQLEGSLAVAPLNSAGMLSVDDLPLAPFWPYVRDLLDLRLERGEFSGHFDYRLDLEDGTELVLDEASATLSSFAVTSAGDEPLARLAQLQFNDTSLDLAQRSVRVGNVRSRGLEAWFSRDANGQLNWQAVLPAQDDTAQAANTPTDPNAAWRIRLPDVQLRDYQLHLTDKQPQTPVNLQLSSLDVDMTGFDSGDNSAFDLQIDTRVAEEGRLSAQGQARLDPPSMEMQVSAENIDLELAQAYIDPLVRMEIREGTLDTTADVQIDSIEPFSLRVNGNAGIFALHVVDTVESRDLLKWERLQLNGIAYSNEGISVERAQLLKPYARLIINQDLSTNVGNLIIGQPADDREDNKKTLGVRIGAVDIQQGSINFADFSLQPNVALTVEELTGQIGTLDNQSATPAELSLAGQVDRYAPVRIEGSLTPFDPLNSLDVEASFKDIELTTLSPYARKFAGYRIRKGRLDLKLHYQIDDGVLEADNQVLLRDLQLGEQVESPSAVDVPVRLAVALLKDGQGNINITLPVQGDLSNPDFDIMPVIWQSFGNLLSRAATAPFRFIANLIGDEEDDLSQVIFTAGEADLDSQARQRLDNLARALKDRPALRLEVEGMSSPAADGPLVAQQRLERELSRRWQKVLEQGQTPASDAEPGIPAEKETELLEDIYRDRLKEPVPEQWAELEVQARTERIRQAVLETWANNDALLRRLAQERNASIKGYLVDSAGLAPSRVQLLDVGIEAVAENSVVPTTLHLGTDQSFDNAP